MEKVGKISTDLFIQNSSQQESDLFVALPKMGPVWDFQSNEALSGDLDEIDCLFV